MPLSRLDCTLFLSLYGHLPYVPSGLGPAPVALRPVPEFLSLRCSVLPGNALHHLLENTGVLILDSAASALGLASLFCATGRTLLTFSLSCPGQAVLGLG